MANTQSILGRYMPVDTRSKSPVLLPLWCVEPNVLITSAVAKVRILAAQECFKVAFGCPEVASELVRQANLLLVGLFWVLT